MAKSSKVSSGQPSGKGDKNFREPTSVGSGDASRHQASAASAGASSQDEANQHAQNQRINQGSRQREAVEIVVEPPEDQETFETIDGEHKCTLNCPIGCRGESRPHEIILFESVQEKRLVPDDFVVSIKNPITVELPVNGFRKAGSRNRRPRHGHHQQPQHQHYQYYCQQRRPFNPDANSNVPYRAAFQVRKRRGSVMPQRVAIAFDAPEVGDEDPAKHKWNPNDASYNIEISDNNPSTFIRRPVAQSTDGARTIKGYSSGVHIFRFRWPLDQRGTHAVVGVSTTSAPLIETGYSSLIGTTDQSWGWDLGRLKAYHQSDTKPGRTFPAYQRGGFSVAEKFYMVLDCDRRSLGFISGGDWLGWSHEDLTPGFTLYPTVSAVWGHCEVEFRYHGGQEQGQPNSLMELCRYEVRQLTKHFDKLELPLTVKDFLNYH